MHQRLHFVVALMLMLSPSLVAAQLRLAGLFTDHMVLQRDQPVPVWGHADPGTEVTVAFASQTRTTHADASGNWMVRLEPMVVSSDGREMVISTGTGADTVVLNDVVVGDVWLCSGQSNMAFRMKQTADAQNEIAEADHPGIRFYRVEQRFAQSPVTELAGEWRPIAPSNAEWCSAVAYYFARAIREHHDVPIGLLVSSVGGTRIETWMKQETLISLGAAAALMETWQALTPEEFERIVREYAAYQNELYNVHPQAVREARAQGRPIPAEPKRPEMRPHACPSALHNGMIAPLVPFAIRGVIWYQGEGNAGQGPLYEQLQPAMISDWRAIWGESIPFLYVQLAPHKSIPPAFRESQERMLKTTPHTAMAVTIDVGDENDIHPTRKRPVGERLALAARAMVYGEAIEHYSPAFREMLIEDNRVTVTFDHAGGGLVARGDTITGFTLAGTDGKFVSADARIEGSRVVVTSPAVPEPVAVRYAWANAPQCNLYNRAGLPVAPFRSDAPASRAVD